MKKNWKQALAALGIKPTSKPKATALFEVDAADGTKLTFPEINDLTELKEGVTTTAEDGEYVFQADGKTYEVEVMGGMVKTVEEVTSGTEDPTMPDGLAEALQAFADEFEAKDAQIEALQTEATALKTSIESLKTLMSHGKDDTEPRNDKTIVVAGKKIDLSKLNKKL